MCEGCPNGILGEMGMPGLYEPEMILADLVQDSSDYKTIVHYATLARNRGAWVVFKYTHQLIGTPSLKTTLLCFTEQSKVIDVVKSLASYCDANPDKPKAFTALQESFGIYSNQPKKIKVPPHLSW